MKRLKKGCRDRNKRYTIGKCTMIFALLFMVAPICVSAQDNTIAPTRSIPLDVSGVHMSSILDNDGNTVNQVDGLYDRGKEEGWKWDSVKKILYLDGLHLETDDSTLSGIILPDGATILLSNENYVKHVQNNGAGIEGKGTLIVKENTEVQGSLEVNTVASGITSTKNLNIVSGSINVTSTSNGMYAVDNLIIEEEANVIVNAKERALFAMHKVIISGGHVSASSLSQEHCAIYTNGDLIIQKGAVVRAEGGVAIDVINNITIESSSVKAIGTKRAGIRSYGNIDINGGTIWAKGGKKENAFFVDSFLHAEENPKAKIELHNIHEKSGAEVAFSDMYFFNGVSGCTTSFVSKDEHKLFVEIGGKANGLNEVFLSEYSEGFDMNGWIGINIIQHTKQALGKLLIEK